VIHALLVATHERRHLLQSFRAFLQVANTGRIAGLVELGVGQEELHQEHGRRQDIGDQDLVGVDALVVRPVDPDLRDRQPGSDGQH